ncbi:MAG: gliding motility-associated C-terminal domain-containing protein [Flavobacteriales bacterium]|jgi:hypothetical protein|nr:gliding motility-associated C-terminal domain-containing protein [Flavobacteriales bacterium]
MKNSLNDLFHERFQGHEAPVDPGTWAVIEAKLLTAAPVSDPVNDLFRERFQNHESAVDPSIWNGISSQLGHPVAGGGWASSFGWMAAGIAGVVAIGALVIALNGGKPEAAIADTMTVEEQGHPATEPVFENLIAEPVVEASMAPVAAPTAARNPVLPENGAGPALLTSASSTPVQAPPAEEKVEVVEQIIEGLTVQTMLEVLAYEPAPTEQPSIPEQQAEQPSTGSGSTTEMPVDEEATKLFMPNTFTPNGDGINDTYRILPRQGFSSVLVRVYSMKNNQLVFSSASIDDEWQGINCDDGMYLVAVEAITLGGRVVADGKVVWLNRGSTN